jgi:hypothetical protein
MTEAEKLKIEIQTVVDSQQVDKLKDKLKKLKEEGGSTKEAFSELGKTLGVAFSVEKVVEFAKESVVAFSQAEAQAQKLAFAVKSINGEGVGALQGLIDQSEKLGSGLFTPEQIQNSQTMLAQLGLTTEQIKKATPVIMDLASATGEDMASATSRFIAGVNGQGKALKDVGIAVKDTGSKTENLSVIMEGLGKFAGATGDALETTSGKTKRLKNAWEEIQVTFGHFLVNQSNDILDFFDSFSIGLDKVTQRRALGVLSDQFKEFSGKIIEEAGKSTEERVKLESDSAKRMSDLSAGLAKTTNKTARAIILEKIKLEKGLFEEIKKLGEGELKIKDDLTQKGIDKQAAADKKISDAHAKAIKDRIDLEKSLADKAIKERDKNDADELSATENLISKVTKLKEEDDLANAGSEEERVAIKKKHDIEEIESEYNLTNQGVEAQKAKADAIADIESKASAQLSDISQKETDDYSDQYFKQLKLDEEKLKKEEELEQATSDAKKKIGEETLSSLSSLEDTVFSIREANLTKGSEAELEAAKRDFKIKKSLSITSAVISGIEGVVNALTAKSIVPEPFGTALKAATAISVGLASAASVAKIAATQFGAGSSSSSSSSVSSAGRGNSGGNLTPQSLQQIGGSNQFNNPLIPISNSNNKTTLPPQKIYVVSTDVTNKQNADQILERRAAFKN